MFKISVFEEGLGVPNTIAEFDNVCELFRMDAMRTEIASVSCTYDPILFCDLLLSLNSLQPLVAQQPSLRTLTLSLIFGTSLNLNLDLNTLEKVVEIGQREMHTKKFEGMLDG